MYWSCIKQTCWMYGVDNDMFYIFISFYLLKPNDLIHKILKKKKEKHQLLHYILLFSPPCPVLPTSLQFQCPSLLTDHCSWLSQPLYLPFMEHSSATLTSTDHAPLFAASTTIWLIITLLFSLIIKYSFFSIIIYLIHLRCPKKLCT